MKLVRMLAVCFAIVFLTPIAARAASPPTPEQVEKARQHMRAGTTLYNETDYAGALVEFQRAYDTAPSYRVLYDIGQAYYQLQNYAAALTTFERYLYEGGDDVAPERRTQVEHDIAELTKRVAKATINVNVPDAEILVDDQVIGKSPLAGPVRISAGRRQIKARKAGMLADEKTLDVTGCGTTGTCDTIVVDLKLTPAQTIVQIQQGSRPLLIGLGIATGVFAVGTATFGALALSASSDWKDKRNAQVSADDQSSAESKTRAFAVTTDILGGLTVLAGVATVYVYFKQRSAEHANPTPTPVPAAHLDFGPGSLNLSGTF
jgi:hypothetical protein